MIEVNHLNKEFTYYKKEVGLKNSFKNLIHKEKLVKKAVNDISFHIDEGEVVGFLGPNGAGKTTIMKLLTDIINKTGGNIIKVFSSIEDMLFNKRKIKQEMKK